MREKGAWSADTYKARTETVKKLGAGRATFEGEKRARQGKGLDSLVDPKERGVIRAANNLLVEKDGKLILEFGVAMPVETDIDTTGSMSGNVDIAFKVQPMVQKLLVQGKGAALRRYHTQMATGVVQDWSDQFPYQRSMFEPDNEVERQMGLLVPERSGGDTPEEYQLSIFAAAYLTDAFITKYGLRGYHFIVGDVTGREEFDKNLLIRVFGSKVLELAKLNGVPSLKAAVKKLLENWHAFFLQVGNDRYSAEWWADRLGGERVIRLPRTEDLAAVQAAVIGLTEGSLDSQSIIDFLREAEISKEEAKKIKEACAGVPAGLQKSFANFDKIPKAGDVFASREDVWPIGNPKKASAKDKGKPGAPKGDGKAWQL